MKAIDLQYERSLALHAAVAKWLHKDPEVLARARTKLDEWLTRGGRSTPLWTRWREILDRPVDEIASFLTERSEDAAWLRQASPFAGVLPPQERLRILRQVRARFEPAA
ncbi:MAG: hypothetical protein ACRD2Z_04180 [Thermoanaerobaculia bacterium]